MASKQTLPLDERFVEIEQKNGRTQKIPALHHHWMQDVQFVSYKPPPLDMDDRGAVGEWLERLKFIEEDLHWLLTLPHDKFWCQIVFDQSFHQLIDSYLKSAPRPYDLLYSQMTPDLRGPHNDVHRKVFMTCVRMATYKETKTDFITPSVFGEILYENFIFDIPKIMDLCALYGQGNGQLLFKMVANIFREQPKYEDDLREAIPTVLEILNRLLSKCGLDDCAGQAPTKLNDLRSETINQMSVSEFQDIIFYLVDISCTLSSFLEIYPQSCVFFHEADICHRLASFYELILPALTAALKTKEFEIPSAKSQLKNRLSLAKKLLLKVFHEVLNHCCIQPILEKSVNENSDVQVADYVEDYLQTVTAIMSERRFLADYEGQYNIQNDLDILRQSPVTIDETRLTFLQEVFDSAFSLYGKRNQPKGSRNAGGRGSPEGSVGDSEERLQAVGNQPADSDISPTSGACKNTPSNDICEGACAATPTGAELESLIYCVKDLFPDFGEGFIEMCLIEMDYSAESVINSLLEDKLPTSLLELDRTMKRGEIAKPLPSPPPSVLEERRNVFDYDEFDVFHRNSVDTTKIHWGKKNHVEEVQINDKVEIETLRPTYEIYGSIDANTIYDKHLLELNLYDDEYDDTYDEFDTSAAGDADNADDLVSRRPFTTPRVLENLSSRDQNRAAGSGREESSDDEEESAKHADHFIEDPAKLRELREQRYRSQRGGNTGWSGKKVIPQQDEKPVHDVKGRGKGKGQTAEVLHNRQWKEKHKSSRANHNRRALADRKRSKGFGLLAPMK